MWGGEYAFSKFTFTHVHAPGSAKSFGLFVKFFILIVFSTMGGVGPLIK